MKRWIPKEGDRFNAYLIRLDKPHPCNPLRCVRVTEHGPCNSRRFVDASNGPGYEGEEGEFAFVLADWRFESVDHSEE